MDNTMTRPDCKKCSHYAVCGIVGAERCDHFEEPRGVYFLCDKNKPDCKKTNCGGEFCKHTRDVNHANNFEKVVDEATGEILGYIEKIGGAKNETE